MPLPSDETTPPVTKTYFVHAHTRPLSREAARIPTSRDSTSSAASVPASPRTHDPYGTAPRSAPLGAPSARGRRAGRRPSRASFLGRSGWHRDDARPRVRSPFDRTRAAHLDIGRRLDGRCHVQRSIRVDLADTSVTERLDDAPADEDVPLGRVHVPARARREAAAVGLDAGDPGPPVGEVVRLGEERPDVRPRRKQLARSLVHSFERASRGTRRRRASARARRGARRRRGARSACASGRRAPSRPGSAGRRGSRSAAGG